MDPSADTATDVPTTDQTPTTGPTAGTAITGDTGYGQVFDCQTVPPVTASEVLLAGPRGYNDILFLDDGTMVTSHREDLYKTTDPATTSLWVPSAGRLTKLGQLAGGNVVAVQESDPPSVRRIAPNGAVTPEVSGLFYGLEVMANDLVLLGTDPIGEGAGIYLLDPAVGSLDLTVSTDIAHRPRDIVLHPDGTRLYWGNLNLGDIYAIDLDPATGQPLGRPIVVVSTPHAWMDAIDIDACGNLYYTTPDAYQLVRVRTDGTTESLLSWSMEDFGHGLAWGDATGGWDDASLYIAHPYTSRVTEFHIGVPGTRWPGTVVNAGRL